MVKKKKDKPEDATPAEDAYVEPLDEPEIAADPEPEYIPTAEVKAMPATGMAPSAGDIASFTMDVAGSNGCTDYKACRDALKDAQAVFAAAWHKAYS